MKVRAIQPGYYGDVYRYAGDVFNIEDKAFSEKWMVIVEQAKPDKGKKAEGAPKSEAGKQA